MCSKIFFLQKEEKVKENLKPMARVLFIIQCLLPLSSLGMESRNTLMQLESKIRHWDTRSEKLLYYG